MKNEHETKKRRTERSAERKKVQNVKRRRRERSMEGKEAQNEKSQNGKKCSKKRHTGRKGKDYEKAEGRNYRSDGVWKHSAECMQCQCGGWKG